MGVALVVRQQRQPAAQEDDVHPGVLAGQGGEAVCGHLLPEAEVAGQKGRGGGHVGDVEGYGGSGYLHGRAPRSGRAGRQSTVYVVQCTSYSVLRTTNARGRMFPCPPSTAAAATP